MEFDIGWSVTDPIFGITVSHSRTIKLGEIALPLAQILSVLRWVMTNAVPVEDRLMQIAQGLQDALRQELDLYRKEEQQDQLAQTMKSMEEQLESSASAERKILILTPTPGAVFWEDTSLVIELSGVPWPFLGLGVQECQRVFVWLNGEELPLTGFEIVDSGMITPISLAGQISFGPTGVSQKEGQRRYRPGLLVDAWGEVPRGTPPNRAISEHYQLSPGKRKTRTGHWASRSVMARPVTVGDSRPNARQRSRCDSGALLESALNKMAGPGSGRTSATGRRLSSRTGRRRRDVPTEKPGRGLSASEEQAVLSAPLLDSAIRMSRNLPLSELHDGINTLIVAVVDGRGQRLQQTVTFLVAESPELEPDLPSIPEWTPPVERPIPRREKGRVSLRVPTSRGMTTIKKSVQALSMKQHLEAIGTFQKTLPERFQDPRKLVTGKEEQCS